MENGLNQSAADLSSELHEHSRERPTKIRWLIFALTCSISFVLYLHRYTWGIVKKNISDEFEWDATQLGTLDSVFSATYGFGQIPSGILCDWFGPHVLLGSIVMLWSLSMGAIVLVGGYYGMFGARFMFGLTQAGCYPTLSKVSKLWFPDKTRTTLQAWIATFFGRGGGAVCFILVGTVMLGWWEMDWRTAIVILTVVGCLFAILFMILFRNSPKDHPWANDAEAELIVEGTPDAVHATRSRLRWSEVLNSGNMRWFFLQQFTSAYADNVFIYWIPFFLLTAKGVDIKSAGWMSAVPLMGGAIGGMLGGTLQNWLIQKTGNRRWSRSSIGLIGKMLATVFIFVSLGFESALLIVVILGVVKFFGDWSQPAVWGSITDIAGRNTASVFGCINTVGSIAGFLAGPTMGFIIDHYAEPQVVQSAVVREVESAEQGAAAGPKETGQYSRVYKLQQTEIISIDWSLAIKRDASGNFLESDSLPMEVNLDKRSGTMTVVWEKDPGSHEVMLDYTYKEYGSGWTMLFFMLGGIYLISSLSWLFIDCTKTLKDESGEEVNEEVPGE